MRSWIIELSVTPPFERFNQRGVLAHLEISEGSSQGQARLWARSWHGMSWMEEEPPISARVGDPVQIDWVLAKSLLDRATAARPAVVPHGNFGLHWTAYRLKISTGLNSCEFAWADEPPVEWDVLGEVARTLESWGHEHAYEP